VQRRITRASVGFFVGTALTVTRLPDRMECMMPDQEQKKNRHASALGKLGKGVAHRITPTERERRRKALAAVRHLRWLKREE